MPPPHRLPPRTVSGCAFTKSHRAMAQAEPLGAAAHAFPCTVADCPHIYGRADMSMTFTALVEALKDEFDDGNMTEDEILDLVDEWLDGCGDLPCGEDTIRDAIEDGLRTRAIDAGCDQADLDGKDHREIAEAAGWDGEDIAEALIEVIAATALEAAAAGSLLDCIRSVTCAVP